jgi:flagellin-like hook-associated protein FlgL
MAEELIPPNDPAPTPTPTRTNRITCDFCGCQLAANGDVLRMSDEAKALQKASHKLDELRAELASVQAQLAEANAAIEEAKKNVTAAVGAAEAHRLFQW